MRYAYIRVSTKDQNLDRQWEAIKGLDEMCIRDSSRCGRRGCKRDEEENSRRGGRTA